MVSCRFISILFAYAALGSALLCAAPKPDTLSLTNGDEFQVEIEKMDGDSIHFFNLKTGELESLALNQLKKSSQSAVVCWAIEDLLDQGKLKLQIRYNSIRPMGEDRELGNFSIVLVNESTMNIPADVQLQSTAYRLGFDLKENGDQYHYVVGSFGKREGPSTQEGLPAGETLELKTLNQLSDKPPYNWVHLSGDEFELGGHSAAANIYLTAIEAEIVYEGKALYVRVSPSRAEEIIRSHDKKSGGIVLPPEAEESDSEPEPVAQKSESDGKAKEKAAPTAPPDISYSSIAIIQSDKGSGTGFLLEMKERQFMVTNSHVITGASRLTAKTTNGEEIYLPSTFFVAKDRDLALFPVSFDGQYLKLPENYDDIKIGDDVTVFGNEAGASVVTQLTGKVNGVGPVRVEIDAKFVEGNSGSPAIHHGTSGVIGLATYYIEYDTPEADIDSDRHFTSNRENKKKRRRFAERIDNAANWDRVTLASLKKEQEALQEFEGFLDGVFMIARGINKDSRVIRPSEGTREVEYILRDFHESFSRSGGYHGNKRAVDDLKRRLETQLDSRRSQAQREITTYYLKEELQYLEQATDVLKDYVNGVYYR
ncbi:S1 family peptidase [Cerasicoccus frondis]|uniref:S1 family peptidase n=1 Tax=Cerasicoccus frondis TaxID=490090 RepID=UPI0028528B6D|nr:serine protease [Cerasicoccus frondis]